MTSCADAARPPTIGESDASSARAREWVCPDLRSIGPARCYQHRAGFFGAFP